MFLFGICGHAKMKIVIIKGFINLHIRNVNNLINFFFLCFVQPDCTKSAHGESPPSVIIRRVFLTTLYVLSDA